MLAALSPVTSAREWNHGDFYGYARKHNDEWSFNVSTSFRDRRRRNADFGHPHILNLRMDDLELENILKTTGANHLIITHRSEHK